LFADLGLAPDLTRAVADQGYTEPTPIQMEAIPVVLDGRDVLAGAQTGTGKTAGFTLPLLQRLMENHTHDGARHVRALVVTPTRELAAQVEESVHDYGKYLPLKSTVIFGGVGMAPQIDALKEGVDILVATPGRLLDHAAEGTVDLTHVEILVLDEADRMLDMGFIHDVRRILALLPAARQNLLFSATFSDDIRELADTLLDNPVSVEVAPRNAESPLVAQRVYAVDQHRKRALLTHLVKSGDWRQVLVFTRTKHGANRLAHQLSRGHITSVAIHGNKGQGARTKALADFKAGAVRVLVATDLAARGLDIVELPHVVNFDMPQVAEDYVHRIGRTGRAGAQGEAVSFVSTDEKPLLAEIENLVGRTFEQELVPGYEPGSVPPQHPNQGPRQQRRDGDVPEGEGEEADEGRQANVLADEAQGSGRGRRRRGRGGRDGRDEQPRQGADGAAESSPSGDGTPDADQTSLQRQPRQPLTRQQRHEQRMEQRAEQRRQRAEAQDNRGNRETRPKHDRNRQRDDDWGNRLQPSKKERRPPWLKADGEIDEALENIGNRLPREKKAPLPGDDEEINYNVALPDDDVALDDEFAEDDTQQPDSNEGQLFPSSAGFMEDARVRGRRRRGRNRNRARAAEGQDMRRAELGLTIPQKQPGQEPGLGHGQGAGGRRGQGGQGGQGGRGGHGGQRDQGDQGQRRHRRRGRGHQGNQGTQGDARGGQGQRQPRLQRGNTQGGQAQQGHAGEERQDRQGRGQQRGRRRNRGRQQQRQAG
jgi:ATP-dependent RNA helicase RhlE